jgi:hypothetical protein
MLRLVFSQEYYYVPPLVYGLALPPRRYASFLSRWRQSYITAKGCTAAMKLLQAFCRCVFIVARYEVLHFVVPVEVLWRFLCHLKYSRRGFSGRVATLRAPQAD